MQLLSSRILMSMGMIVFVGALAASATGAFFSDTETSTGNTFAAGALDLTIDNTSYGFDWNDPTNPDPSGIWGPNPNHTWDLGNLDNCGPEGDQPCLFFNFHDLKPGDYGEDTISLHVQNDAWACMAFDLTSTPENSVNEPETDAGDTAANGPNDGELQNFLSFIFWRDDGDNVLENDEDVIEDLSGLPGEAFTGEWLSIADQGDTPLQAESVNYIGKGWCFGAMVAAPVTQDNASSSPPQAPNRIGFTCNGVGEHNIAQTDGIVVDVHFYGVQSRNNDDFQCSALPQVDPQEGTITITKVLDNGQLGTAAVTDFQFQIDGGAATAFEADATNVVVVSAGAHTVTEVAEAGYGTTYANNLNANLNCDALVVPDGGNVTCTITNTFGEGTITVQKVLNTTGDDETGGAVPTEASFAPFEVDATAVSEGVATTFAAGSYTVSETVDPDYNAVFSGDCDGAGNITLAAGENLTCTITNTFDGSDDDV